MFYLALERSGLNTIESVLKDVKTATAAAASTDSSASGAKPLSDGTPRLVLFDGWSDPAGWKAAARKTVSADTKSAPAAGTGGPFASTHVLTDVGMSFSSCKSVACGGVVLMRCGGDAWCLGSLPAVAKAITKEFVSLPTPPASKAAPTTAAGGVPTPPAPTPTPTAVVFIDSLATLALLQATSDPAAATASVCQFLAALKRAGVGPIITTLHSDMLDVSATADAIAVR